jgi:hypothetical protein
MAQINIKYTTGSNVENPTTDQVAIFTSGSLGSSSLYLKESDGTIITVGSGSGGGGGVGPQGSQGPTGPQGNQGNQGPLGPQGNQGNQGPTGADSNVAGPQGNQGPLGPQGNQGPTGADSNVAGPQGAEGAQGPTGPQGPTGADSNVAGPQGNQGPLGPQGNQGPTGADSNVAGPQGAAGAQGPTGPQGPTGADSNVAGPQGAEGAQGPVGPQGNDGSGGGGASYNPLIRYVANASPEIEILSSGNVEGGLSWTRSSTTLTVTDPSHGLTTEDYVVIRNMSEDYSYVSITDVDGDSFTCTVSDSGGTSGSEGAYIPAVKATSVTDDGCTISSPSAGNVQVISIKAITGTKSGTTYDLTMPTSLTNGAGANTSITNQNPPIVQNYKLDTGALNAGASVTVNTSNNFNVFQVGGMNQLINNLIKFTF